MPSFFRRAAKYAGYGAFAGCISGFFSGSPSYMLGSAILKNDDPLSFLNNLYATLSATISGTIVGAATGITIAISEEINPEAHPTLCKFAGYFSYSLPLLLPITVNIIGSAIDSAFLTDCGTVIKNGNFICPPIKRPFLGPQFKSMTVGSIALEGVACFAGTLYEGYRFFTERNPRPTEQNHDVNPPYAQLNNA